MPVATSSPNETSPDRDSALLAERLAHVDTREAWIDLCREAWQRLADSRIREVVRPADVADGVRTILSPDVVRTLIGPLVRDLHQDVVAHLRKDGTTLGEYVPDAARRAIEALMERRDLIPEAFVRKLFEQQAVQDAIYDTLYEGLTQFNTTVNPFFAEWGLPAFLKRMPIGGSVILASVEALRSEFERRLEPEIRKFLAPFSRKATGQIAEAFLAKSGDPKFVELRKNLVVFVYSQSLAEILARVDDKAAGDVGAAVESILLELVRRDRVAAMVQDLAESFVAEHGETTVTHWLERIGADASQVVEPWADFVWPAVEKALHREDVRRMFVITVELRST